MKGIQQQWIGVKILEKTLSEFKKERKRGKIASGILKQPLENTLGFKGIQTLQVLEAWRAIQVCDFWTYLNLEVFHVILRTPDVFYIIFLSYSSLFHSLLFLSVQYIYACCILVCMCCRVRALCTTWFKISLI